ncbi:flagellar export protein FliJ [Peribacillus loiseleuriae]|uniref:Flagellar FliJ protein n=1 Tax=Peribacillus loiseleuriae TaxID=1679170 RepID=A0A0K9GRX4_9BACI|nr:flagellar export protein FliJ [Peribacillus loiseleuriae]KMY49449.1 flagellar biosynthesis chaperone [Peribacillus loiseleuriae]
MIYQYKFDKILTIKENEKNDVLVKYNETIKKFEEVAEKLYKLLKKKEDLLQFQQEKLTQGLTVQEIRHNQQFMDNLENIIMHNQKEVIKARQAMNTQQSKLMEKNIEVKKYEKIKEKDFQKFLEEIKEVENKDMDEISIRQFLSKG